MNINDLKELVKDCVYMEDGIVCMNNDYYSNILKEIERLNNIINELEKFINERIAILKEEQQEFEEDMSLSNWEEQRSYRNEILIRANGIIQLEDTLDKLKELKGE